MAQSIYIIDLQWLGLPEPTTLQEMWMQVEPRLQQEAPVNAKFVDLAQRLVDRFPNPDAEPDDPLAEESVWLIDPVEQAEGHERQVWNLGLPVEQNVQVLHEAVRQATALGLSVLADHLGVAFLPGNKIVPASLQEQWEVLFEDLPAETLEPPQRLTKAHVRKQLKAMLAQRLEPHGFALSKESWVDIHGKKDPDVAFFIRESDEGWQGIYLWWSGRAGIGYECGCAAYGVNFAVQRILRHAGFDVATSRIKGDYEFYLDKVVSLGGLSRVGNKIDIGGDEGLDLEKLDRLFGLVAGPLRELLDEMRSVDGINAVLNERRHQRPGDRVCQHGENLRAALASSHLLENSHFEPLVANAFKHWDADTPHQQSLRDALRKLMDLGSNRVGTPNE